MANLKIGIQTRSLRRPLKQALHIAADLGATGVEIDARSEIVPSQLSQTGRRQLRRLLDDLNLRVSAIAFPTRRGYDVSEDLERRVAATQMAMKLAYELGSQVVINRVGHVPDEPADPSFQRLAETLTALGVYGQRIGARLAAQTATESGPQLARLLAALPDQSVGADLHPSALIQAGYCPLEAATHLGPFLLHVHACDAVRDLGRGQNFDVELGRGSAELPAILGQLAEFNYCGWVTIERRDSSSPAEEVGNAVAYLQSL